MPTMKKYLHKRSSSSGNGDQLSVASFPNMSSGATVATAISEGNKSAQTEGSPTATSNGNGGKQPKTDTEVAAMQQLAFLVVSLRSDLREATLARDEMEQKLEKVEAANDQQQAKSKNSTSTKGGEAKGGESKGGESKGGDGGDFEENELLMMVAVAAGRQPRTRCWIRLCVIELSHAANHHCASRTKQGRFCSVS